MNEKILKIFKDAYKYPGLVEQKPESMILELIAYTSIHKASCINVFKHNSTCLVRIVRWDPPEMLAFEQFDTILGTNAYTYASDKNVNVADIEGFLNKYPKDHNEWFSGGMVIDGIWRMLKIPSMGVEGSWLLGSAEKLDSWVEPLIEKYLSYKRE